MNRFRLLLLTAVCVMPAAISAAQDNPLIPLPSDPSTVIITMDWRGEYGAPRANLNPALTVRADGRVTVAVIDARGNTGSKETVLSPAEIQDLLRFVITEQDFFAINATGIRRAIAAEEARTGTGYSPFDYPDTILHIKTATQEHEASYNALEFWVQHYPSIKALGQFRAIEIRLTRLVEDVKAGRK